MLYPLWVYGEWESSWITAQGLGRDAVVHEFQVNMPYAHGGVPGQRQRERLRAGRAPGIFLGRNQPEQLHPKQPL